MDELISIENLIEEAKQKGIDFGKGDPYNRLRYYTKIGWLPHMIRKRDSSGKTRGHYFTWAVDRLILIEGLKANGVSNDEISKALKVKNKVQTLFDVLKTKETRNQAIAYVSFAVLLLILSNELGLIRLGKQKTYFSDTTATTLSTNDSPKQIIESGTSFFPKNQNKLFIGAPSVKTTYKIYVAFNQDYSPASRFWVSSVEDSKGFVVSLDAPVFNNTEINWWVTN